MFFKKSIFRKAWFKKKTISSNNCAKQLLRYRQLLNVIRHGKPKKTQVFIITILTLIATLSSLVVPLLAKEIIDSFNGLNLFPYGLILTLVAVLFIGAVTAGINYYYLGNFGNRVLVNLRSKIFEKSLLLPIAYYDKNSSSDLTSRIVNDTLVINGFVSRQLEPLMSSILTLIASLCVLIYLDWELTLMLIISLLLALSIVLSVAMKLTTLSTLLQEKEASFLKFIFDHLSNIKLIKAYTSENQTIEKNTSVLRDIYDIKDRQAKAGAFISPISRATVIIALICVLGFAAARVNQGFITIGEMVAFILYLFNIINPITQLTGLNIAVNEAAGASVRIEDILKTPIEKKSNDIIIQTDKARILFENVGFRYGDNSLALEGINFEVKPNKMIALVGESGSGKSTIFSLLLRYYQPSTGEIYIGNNKLSDISSLNWRQKTGYIAQDAPMICGSIHFNLTMGMTEIPSQLEIANALSAAQLTDFIDHLPNGINTEVGENGCLLSGGQKQRLSIARAILQKTPFLFCDEPTSCLDSTTESKIQSSMKQLNKNRTLIVAAHRLSTVMDADRIIVLSQGKIVAEGTHKELLNNKYYYQNLLYQKNGH